DDTGRRDIECVHPPQCCYGGRAVFGELNCMIACPGDYVNLENEPDYGWPRDRPHHHHSIIDPTDPITNPITNRAVLAFGSCCGLESRLESPRSGGGVELRPLQNLTLFCACAHRRFPLPLGPRNLNETLTNQLERFYGT